MYEGAPNWPGRGPLLGDHREVPGRPSSTPPRPPSARSSSGATSTVEKHDLSSLRLLGTVGEGINPEAWMWYHHKIGGERCPIVDTWWQTETGGIMMTPAARRDPHQAGQLHQAAARHRARDRRRGRQAGAAQPRRLAGDHQALARHAPRHLGRRRALPGQYWSKVPGKYLTGDNARCDDGRLLLDHGPHRRRAERLRPPAEHDRDRKRPGQPPGRRRSGRRRPARRAQGRGRRRVRHAARRREPTEAAARRS